MAKSHTVKKQKIKQLADKQVKMEMVRTASDIVSSYVKSWAQSETQRLILDNTIAVIPVANGFQVGKHRVTKHEQMWRLHNYFNEPMHDFIDRRSAMLYSILYQVKRYKTADEVLTKDQRLSKLEADFQHYSFSMQRAIKRKDNSAVDVLAARYYDTRIYLESAKNDLEKTLRMNKYLKVWETGTPL